MNVLSNVLVSLVKDKFMYFQSRFKAEKTVQPSWKVEFENMWYRAQRENITYGSLYPQRQENKFTNFSKLEYVSDDQMKLRVGGRV